MSHQTHFGNSVLAPRSKFYQGPFGRICPNLEPWAPAGTVEEQDAFFLEFARKNMVELPGVSPADIAGDENTINDLESKFGSQIPAGYTYFGQFIDHDITLDTTPLAARQVDPDRILNFRTPRLDLDCVYGRGEGDQPYLYDKKDKEKLLIGNIAGTNLRDLPRNIEGRALIGDKRNDENSIVSQLQLAFLLAHNELVDRARAAGINDGFGAARKTLTRLYHWIVWNDFVRRIAIDEVYECALQLESKCGGRKVWELGLKDVYLWKNQPYMPVEFSGAAYRFGHSMVRNSYQTNDPHRGFRNFAPIFDNTGGVDPDDLRGFRAMKKENVVQWDWFLQMDSSAPGLFPQMARKIDTKLANALAHLHESTTPGVPENVLAFLNLKRGVNLGLPSGPDVAKKFCLKPVSLTEKEPQSLWYYVLKEAEKLPGANGGESLGRVGSTIVCAVLAGLLKGDPCSYLNTDPCWEPKADPLLKPGQDNIDDENWTLASIIRLSGLPVNGGDVNDQT